MDLGLAGARVLVTGGASNIGRGIVHGFAAERVFVDPHAFDITRPENPHVGFGGGGPHFCLGNQLAKTQLRFLFHELLTRAPGLQLGAPTTWSGTSSTP